MTREPETTRPSRSTRREFDAWDQQYQREDDQRMPWHSSRPSPWLVRATDGPGRAKRAPEKLGEIIAELPPFL